MLAIKKYYRHIAELHESNLVNMYKMKKQKVPGPIDLNLTGSQPFLI